MIVYLIVRPPEYLDDVRERELEIQAAEARMANTGCSSARTATTRSRRTSCAARRACASSRSPASAAAGRSTRVEDLPVLRDRDRRQAAPVRDRRAVTRAAADDRRAAAV